MSDIMAQKGKNPLEQNLSLGNATDLAVMKKQGGFSPDMTVRDALGKFGIDVDGPATQLISFAQQQAKMADPMEKMKAVAGKSGMGPGMGPGAGTPPPPSAQPTPPPSGGSLDDLMQKGY